METGIGEQGWEGMGIEVNPGGGIKTGKGEPSSSGTDNHYPTGNRLTVTRPMN